MKTPEEIVHILHSIESLTIDKYGELWTTFNDEPKFGDGRDVSTISSFQHGSFTYELLVLIENHLPYAAERARTDTPEFVISVLHIIDTVAIRDGVLEMIFKDGHTYGGERVVMTIEEFKRGSFTRELLLLIESHLTQDATEEIPAE